MATITIRSSDGHCKSISSPDIGVIAAAYRRSVGMSDTGVSDDGVCVAELDGCTIADIEAASPSEHSHYCDSMADRDLYIEDLLSDRNFRHIRTETYYLPSAGEPMWRVIFRKARPEDDGPHGPVWIESMEGRDHWTAALDDGTELHLRIVPYSMDDCWREECSDAQRLEDWSDGYWHWTQLQLTRYDAGGRVLGTAQVDGVASDDPRLLDHAALGVEDTYGPTGRRFNNAIAIDAGACNVRGVVRSLMDACTEADDSGINPAADNAVRLMVHQLAHLCGTVAMLGSYPEYERVLRACEESCADTADRG